MRNKELRGLRDRRSGSLKLILSNRNALGAAQKNRHAEISQKVQHANIVCSAPPEVDS